MAPQAQHFHDPLWLQNLIHQTMLDVDTSITGTPKIPHQGFIGRRLPEGVVGQKIEQGLGLLLQAWGCRSQFSGVLLGRSREQNSPAHQPGSLLNSSMVAAMPSRIDSRMPGIETKCRVS